MPEIDGYEVSNTQFSNLQRSVAHDTVGAVFETETGRIFIPIEVFKVWEAWGRDEDPVAEISEATLAFIQALDTGGTEAKTRAGELLSKALGEEVVLDKIANRLFVKKVESGVQVDVVEQELMASRWPLVRILKGLFAKAEKEKEQREEL